jgi:hypothetical protein
MGKIFKMPSIWVDPAHVMSMASIEYVQFLNNQTKDEMILDGFKDVIHLYKTDEKELFFNNENDLIWKEHLYSKDYIDNAKRILDELRDGNPHYYMPTFMFPMAVVGESLALFIAPKYLGDWKPEVLKPPVHQDSTLTSEESQ